MTLRPVRMTVLLDGERMVVGCQVCGAGCGLPPDMTPAGLREFLEQHPPDGGGEVHPADCPEWSVGESVA